jgi:serine protease AprX
VNGSLASAASDPAEATTPPVTAVVIHVASLTGSSAANGKSGWRATARAEVRDSNDAPVANATVSGDWSDGFTGAASCVTGSTGVCTMTTSKLNNGTPSVTFTLTNVTHPTATYDGAANGTSVLIPK